MPVLPCLHETERLILRLFTAADVDAVHGYQSLEAVGRYQMWEPRTRDQVKAVLEKYMSWRVMERVGMRREAHFREHAIFKGDWDEEFYYAMLSTEWAELRRGAN